MDKLKDAGSRENHGCDGLTASRKLPAYDWKFYNKQYKIGDNFTDPGSRGTPLSVIP